MAHDSPHAPRVVVVGGGFGGLRTVRSLARADAAITLIDRHNYHLFQPLSYQVATGALSPGEIAVPLRRILRGQSNVRVVMGDVRGIDLERRELSLAGVLPGVGARTEPYDILVVAGGSSYSYFGHDEWRSLALEVKSLDSALRVRGRILGAFEAAELESDAERRRAWLTFVVIGAGPTGVEMAGQIAELAYDTLPRELRAADPGAGRVLLVEMAPRVLTGFPDSLSRRAARSLEGLGVKLLLGHTLVDVKSGSVTLSEPGGPNREVQARTVVWAAGVSASPLAELLARASAAEQDRAGRVIVEPDLTLPGHPEVFALGDMVAVRQADGAGTLVLPGVAPVAMQQGRHAARVIRSRLRDGTAAVAPPAAGAAAGPRPAPELRPFRYRDKGNLATIGRARAVADIHGIRLSGLPAWITWLLVHVFYLIGFENRLTVLLRWSHSFFTRGRGTRLITEAAGEAGG
ncbi:MAG: NAD(P)/FAD-dependent oxidoreductase [Acidobacteriota bacterium]|nr:NAD(P)/FAD-dependent oxidoreductase [Acidobacteriota bacterium]